MEKNLIAFDHFTQCFHFAVFYSSSMTSNEGVSMKISTITVIYDQVELHFFCQMFSNVSLSRGEFSAITVWLSLLIEAMC